MGKTGNIWNRVKAVVVLVLVFLLVLATNLMDNHHFDVVKRSLTSVYEDRLLVKDYLYKMSRQLQLKEKHLKERSAHLSRQLGVQSTDSIQTLINKYSATKMTALEASIYENLYAQWQTLKGKEASFLQGGAELSESQIDELWGLNWQLRETIDHLFEIQKNEGKRQIAFSNRAIAKSDLMAKLEIGALIVIGLIIQVIVFYRPD